MPRKKAATRSASKDPPVRRKPDASRRDSLIKVLATEEERKSFQAAADRMGLSLSTWMRAVALAMSKEPSVSVPSGEG